MDPISAVSLAGTVVQFVTFVQSILSKTSEIHNSALGKPADLANILSVYEHLQSFSAKFSSQSSQALHLASKNTDDELEISALVNILQATKADCDQILELVNKLNIKQGPSRRWKSFKVALELVWNRTEIEELDKRLQRTQSAVTLHICAMMNRLHESYHVEFLKLRDTCSKYQINHAQKIESVFGILQTIESRYFPPKPGPGGNSVTPDNVLVVQPQDIDALAKQVTELSLTSQSICWQQSIIESLNFEHRPMRHNRIPMAHNETFGWVHLPRYLETKCGLLNWLRTQAEIFWVSGKPGSGKSTFMKYLADDDRTQRELDAWAYPQRVLIASHYFWNAGTEMQKSQQGLLQEILLKIFRQRPELIKSSCGERILDSKPKDHYQPPWSAAELRRALQRLADSGDNIKICLFIDGLDEYSGDHYEFCEDLLKLVRSGKIKMCLSSRSWNVFEDAFGHHPMLRIHDLTQSDIRTYVKSSLSGHVRWPHLHDQPNSGDHIISEVVERARGVFLWVSIVTKLLREGLTNDDSSADLLRRLEQFPTDLEPFFKHMLDTVEPFYHHKMSGSLQIAIASRAPLLYPFYSYHENEYDDGDYALKLKAKKTALQPLTLTRIHRKVVRRLDGHCKGLLEVGDSYVTFLHRTVADFLKTREMRDYLIEKGLPTFNPKLAILKASLAFIKTFTATIYEGLMCDHPVGNSIEEAHAHISQGISLAAELETESAANGDAIEDILDDMENSLYLINSPTLYIIPQAGRTWEQAAKAYFRGKIIRYGVVEYMRKKIAQDPDYLAEFDGPPLTILAHRDNQGLSRRKVYGTLKLLLEDGEDPNENYTSESEDPDAIGWTPWTFFLSQGINPHGSIDYGYIPKLDGRLFLVYLEHGADRNAKIFRSIRDGVANSSTAWVDFLLLSLTMKSEWATESAYLEVLDAFLSGDINMCDSVYIPSSGDTQSVHEAFFSGLRQQLKLQEETNEISSTIHIRQLRLWRKITLKLLVKAYGQNWPLDELWSTIKDIFGSRQQKLMQAQYMSSCSGKELEAGIRANKRDRECVGDEGRASKISKLEL
ncbi:hypothetical protein F4679DRAFT_485867 [Xylaria curta]|nr:hypothetical protein F4679DRAFT_485867 [Xylaria curta]